MAKGPAGFQKPAINGAPNGDRRDPEYLGCLVNLVA
jgi:hypothetical protein